jgi:hypothetical protein
MHASRQADKKTDKQTVILTQTNRNRETGRQRGNATERKRQRTRKAERQ